MKTQLQVLVKDESFLSKCQSTVWFVSIFKKSKIYLELDGEAKELKASKEPYVFDLNPGTHYLLVSDPKAKSKRRKRAVTGAIVGATFGMMAGNVDTMVSFGSDMAGTFAGNVGEDGSVEFTVDEGDIIKISCKATLKGGVKIKQIN